MIILQCQTPSSTTNTIRIRNIAQGLSPIPNDSANRHVQLPLLVFWTVSLVSCSRKRTSSYCNQSCGPQLSKCIPAFSSEDRDVVHYSQYQAMDTAHILISVTLDLSHLLLKQSIINLRKHSSGKGKHRDSESEIVRKMDCE
jgi:hypothetical protein